MLFHEQEERDAMDNDSNYSAESFERKKRNEKGTKGTALSKRLGSIVGSEMSQLNEKFDIGSQDGASKSILSGK